MTEGSIKYSFLTPYYKRYEYLNKGLESLVEQYSYRSDFEIVIVEDLKNYQDEKERNLLQGVIDRYKNTLQIRYVLYNDIKYNPAPLFNIGANIARGRFLVINNPENVHKKDNLMAFDKHFEDGKIKYVAGCCRCVQLNFATGVVTEKHWIQRPPAKNYFIAAIDKDFFNSIGGFDHRFGDGISGEDNDFVKRIEDHPESHCIATEDVFVWHLDHPRIWETFPNYQDKFNKNKALLKAKWGDFF